MTKDDREIVSAVRSRLADKVGQERFNLWFGAAVRLDYNGGALRIGAPSQFFLEWIRTNFRRQVEEACSEVLGTCPPLEFHLDAPSSGGGASSDGSTSGEGNGDSMQQAENKAALKKLPCDAPQPASAGLRGAAALGCAYRLARPQAAVPRCRG